LGQKGGQDAVKHQKGREQGVGESGVRRRERGTNPKKGKKGKSVGGRISFKSTGSAKRRFRKRVATKEKKDQTFTRTTDLREGQFNQEKGGGWRSRRHSWKENPEKKSEESKKYPPEGRPPGLQGRNLVSGNPRRGLGFGKKKTGAYRRPTKNTGPASSRRGRPSTTRVQEFTRSTREAGRKNRSLVKKGFRPNIKRPLSDGKRKSSGREGATWSDQRSN